MDLNHRIPKEADLQSAVLTTIRPSHMVMAERIELIIITLKGLCPYHQTMPPFWQEQKDLNPHKQLWRLMCCHYTILLYGWDNWTRTNKTRVKVLCVTNYTISQYFWRDIRDLNSYLLFGKQKCYHYTNISQHLYSDAIGK